MALRFDPGAYGSAYQLGQQNEQADRDRRLALLQNAVQGIGQGIQSYQTGQRQRTQDERYRQLYEMKLAEMQRAREFEDTTYEQLLSRNSTSSPVAPLSLLDKAPAPIAQGEGGLPMGQQPGMPRRSLMDQFRSGEWKNRLNQPPQVDMSSQALAKPDLSALGIPQELLGLTPRQISSMKPLFEARKYADAGTSDFIPPADFQSALEGDTSSIVERNPKGVPSRVATLAATSQRAKESATAREESRKMSLSKEDEDRIRNIRNDIQGSQAYKDWIQIKNASDNLSNAAKNPTKKRTLGALYSYVKALDPNSVVREGEISLSQEARSGFDRVQGAINKLTKGQILNPDEVQEMADWAKEKEGLSRQTAIASNKPSINQAKRRNYDLKEINEDLFGEDSPIDQKPILRWNPATGRVEPY